MRAPVERNDARVVHHLVEQHHVVLGLEQLHVLVVAAGRHRRAGVEADDATHLQRVRTHVLDPAAGGDVVHEQPAPHLLQVRPLLRRGCRQRRHTAVRRIDDERRAPRLDRAVARVEPELVVVADHVGRLLVVAHGELGQPPGLVFRRLLRGQHRLVAQLLRAFERRERAEVPDALEVRRAPRGARRVPVLVLGGGGSGREQQTGDNCRHGERVRSMTHRKPPSDLSLCLSPCRVPPRVAGAAQRGYCCWPAASRSSARAPDRMFGSA